MTVNKRAILYLAAFGAGVLLGSGLLGAAGNEAGERGLGFSHPPILSPSPQGEREKKNVKELAASSGAPAAGREQAAKRKGPPAKHVVFVTGDDEYRSEITMPLIAGMLPTAGFRSSIASAKPTPQTENNIEGLEALRTADLMVIFTRFRALPDDQLKLITDYVASGKPVIGLRTSTHAFNYPKDSPHVPLNDGFGTDLFGQKWITHHGHRSSTDVTLRASATTREGGKPHPILRGVGPFHARSWLYHVEPLVGENTILLDGASLDSEKKPEQLEKFPPRQPVAWTRSHQGARVFFTTLGHPADFEQESMRRLLVNAIYWALGADVPEHANVVLPTGWVAPETFDLSKVKRSIAPR